MKLSSLRKKWLIPVLLAPLIGTASVVAVTNFGTQAFTHPAIGPAAALKLLVNCGFPDTSIPPGTIPGFPAPGTTGFVWPADLGLIYSCEDVNDDSALTVLAADSFTATFTPNPLPLPFTDVGLVPQSLAGQTCSSSDIVADLGTTSATVPLTDGLFNYCVFFDLSMTPTLAAFPSLSVTWSGP